MALLLLEALGALALLLFIVWWTMFSGRKHGELPSERLDDDGGAAHKAVDAVDAINAVDSVEADGSGDDNAKDHDKGKPRR